MKIVLATHNKDKIKEIKALLYDLPIDILTYKDFDVFPDVVENQDTLVGNAEKKAREIFEITGIPAMADDTGLFVDALSGAPGVYSSRYAGEDVTYADNRHLLLQNMRDITLENRDAEFKTVIVLVMNKNNKYIVEGSCPGYIGFEEKGDMGFGYDPIFYLKDSGKTFAELSIDEKNIISHRGRALKKIKEILKEIVQKIHDNEENYG
ncbi:MAG: RdgB/HAM1 family non-canonical purine NTP pyrophosphatase [Candidatus Cloacimonetes bacterium]|nr:RdgB/HAM1 family non-canonical purine NTP pyrophosphatase [Candidatus Cloacimonadota bacterium]